MMFQRSEQSHSSSSLCSSAVTHVGRKRKALEDEGSERPSKLTSKEVRVILPDLLLRSDVSSIYPDTTDGYVRFIVL